jgi:uncharacterized protein
VKQKESPGARDVGSEGFASWNEAKSNTEIAEGKALEAENEKLKRCTRRECGSCSLCCKIFRIEEPGFKKPANKWCVHCPPGNGCSIYADRPNVCRGFACDWLINKQLSDAWCPATSKIVVRELNERGFYIREFNVDHSYPHRWREELYYSLIKKTSLSLAEARRKAHVTRVVVGDTYYYVFCDAELKRKFALTDEARDEIVKAFEEMEDDFGVIG